MSNFIDDSTSLDFPKKSIRTYPAGYQDYTLRASDWNKVCQALYDTREALVNVRDIVIGGAVVAKSLRLAPTTIQAFLSPGVNDPWIPTDFNNGAQTTIHCRTSAFNSELRSLPRGTADGDMCVLVHAGDGGAVTTQAGLLKIRHMWPDYDSGLTGTGDSSVYAGFYCPGQRDITMMPADTLILRFDTGHVSWRVVGMTNSGRVKWGIADLLSGAYEGAISPAALPSGNTDLYTPTTGSGDTLVEGRLVSVWRLQGHAAGSNLLGLVPPVAKHWNGSQYRSHRDFRILYNFGAGPIVLKMNASSAAEYKMVGDSLSDHTIPVWGSRLLMYEPEHNFWLVIGKP